MQGFITSMPTGKVNTFGNHTLPDAVVVKMRSSRPISFVGAFEEPCRKGQDSGGYVQEAAARLARYIPEIEAAYGVTEDAETWVLSFGKNAEHLSGLGTQVSLPELVDAVGEEVARRQEAAQ